MIPPGGVRRQTSQTLRGERAVSTSLPLPEPPLSVEQLMEKQGICEPQGLAAFVDPEWELGEASDRFLETVFSGTD